LFLDLGKKIADLCGQRISLGFRFIVGCMPETIEFSRLCLGMRGVKRFESGAKTLDLKAQIVRLEFGCGGRRGARAGSSALAWADRCRSSNGSPLPRLSGT